MGSGASTLQLENLSAEDIGGYTAGIGKAYAGYKDIIISNGISGDVLAGLDDASMKELLTSAGITNTLHQTVLISNLKKLKGGSSGGGNQTGSQNVNPDCCQFHPLPSDFTVGEMVTVPPRSIMTKLFEIQGISVDPTDLDPAVDKIARAVGGGFGDGKTKYDCFINYRVAADADLAEKLFLYLRTKGIYAFLDKKCLKNGEKWKDGFLTGLKNSKCFVALISRKALDRVRDKSSDHTYDNVLLEYETALNIMQVTTNAKFICPLHVGECNGGNLSKFMDFNPGLYPDSIKAISESNPAPNVPTKAAPPAPPADDDEGNDGGEVEEPEVDHGDEENHEHGEAITCPKCYEGLTLKPAGTWGDGWSCDWPSHEGSNYFTRNDQMYGCPTVKICNWGVCQTCWNDYNNQQNEQKSETEVLDCPQPEGTKSVYNEEYYCEIKKLRFESHDEEQVRMVVEYNVRGDMSLGPLQDPTESHIEAGDLHRNPTDVKVYFKDDYQNRGELTFMIDMDEIDTLLTHRTCFVFGESGYSPAVLVLPNSKVRDVELPMCSSGDHRMVISDYAEEGYSNGWCCDICRRGGNGLRWFCEECSSDKCFSCEPLRAMYPHCGKDPDHELQRATGLTFGNRYCDECRRGQLQNDPEFYHCGTDGFDMCLKCASSQQKEILDEQ